MSSNNKRLFTFGCSFTDYDWPTWANILSVDAQFTEFQNWGWEGGGNHLVLYSLNECIARNNINKNDTVGIMWTSISRDDRYIRHKWEGRGTVYKDNELRDYVENFTDPDDYYLKTVNIISIVKKLLDNIGCNYYFFYMTGIDVVDEFFLSKITQILSFEGKVKKVFPEVFESKTTSFFDLMDKPWFDSDLIIPKCIHEKMKNLKRIFDENAGCDWPSYEQFLIDDYSSTSKEIYNEIENQFNLRTYKDQLVFNRCDLHPTPLEHYHFLEEMGVKLSAKQKEFAIKWEKIAREDVKSKAWPVDRRNEFDKTRRKIKRF